MKKTLASITTVITITIVSVMNISSTPGNEGYQIGDKVDDFNLKNVDGKMVSLSGLTDNKGAIVIFTCNHCPFSKAYEDRIIALDEKFKSQGYPVIAINPNDSKKVPEDSFRNMIRRAKEKKFTFPYLHDETQQTAKTFGAARTPHVFILSKSEGEYTVEYIGAIDNNTDDGNAADKKYVENAMSEIMEGKEVSTNMTKAIGCTIKWKS